MITISPAWSAAYPGACAGFLAMRGAANPDHNVLLISPGARVELLSVYGAA